VCSNQLIPVFAHLKDIGGRAKMCFQLCGFPSGMLLVAITKGSGDSAVGNPQECFGGVRGSHVGAFGMYISGCGGRKYVGIQDLTTNSRYRWGLPLSGILLIFILLSSTLVYFQFEVLNDVGFTHIHLMSCPPNSLNFGFPFFLLPFCQ